MPHSANRQQHVLTTTGLQRPVSNSSQLATHSVRRRHHAIPHARVTLQPVHVRIQLIRRHPGLALSNQRHVGIARRHGTNPLSSGTSATLHETARTMRQQFSRILLRLTGRLKMQRTLTSKLASPAFLRIAPAHRPIRPHMMTCHNTPPPRATTTATRSTNNLTPRQ